MRPATHFGSMGVTRSGKSGLAAVRWTDGVLTRRGVVLGYIDLAKPEQSIAGPLLDDLVFYADTQVKARTIFKALFALVRDRAARMGRAGHRDWTMKTYDELGTPALVVAADEIQFIMADKDFVSLATACLSVGIYLDILLPRADSMSMDTRLRHSIPSWMCFGTGDSYSEAFALTEDTRDAGAATASWGATKPGYHYWDMVPGVDRRKFAMVARSFRADFAELASSAKAGRAFRAQLHPDDVRALGKALEMCDPRNAAARWPADVVAQQEEGDVTKRDVIRVDGADSVIGEPVEYDEDDRPAVPSGEGIDPAEQAEIERIDLRQPFPARPVGDDGIRLPDPVPPASSDGDMNAEIDRVLREMADEGISEFENADILARCRMWKPPAMSTRLTGYAEDKVLSPPGLSIKRLGRGRWRLLYEAMNGATK